MTLTCSWLVYFSCCKRAGEGGLAILPAAQGRPSLASPPPPTEPGVCSTAHPGNLSREGVDSPPHCHTGLSTGQDTHLERLLGYTVLYSLQHIHVGM